MKSKMKLSQAIRIGAACRPQTKHHLFHYEVCHNTLCSCAIGAAYEGLTSYTLQGTGASAYLILKKFVDDPAMKVKCPFVSEMMSLQMALTHLNDIVGWTREKIADWLEDIEL